MFRRLQRPSVPAEESTAPKPNIVVIGGSYVGGSVVDLLASSLHRTHNIVLIEKNSHFQHLFAFPRSTWFYLCDTCHRREDSPWPSHTG
ncbi:hypothetical protein F5146DRAFT_651507 [Armillaria mellea]|nr:hypothetical protein F5146DRAFT_651507 [Armillaria mellea]